MEYKNSTTELRLKVCAEVEGNLTNSPYTSVYSNDSWRYGINTHVIWMICFDMCLPAISSVALVLKKQQKKTLHTSSFGRI